jgi:hypothetical protein
MVRSRPRRLGWGQFEVWRDTTTRSRCESYQSRLKTFLPIELGQNAVGVAGRGATAANEHGDTVGLYWNGGVCASINSVTAQDGS